MFIDVFCMPFCLTSTFSFWRILIISRICFQFSALLYSGANLSFYVSFYLLFGIVTWLALNVGTFGVENVDSESRVSPGNPALKAKLMSIFCRSVAAANSFPSTLQCIFGCIYGSRLYSALMMLTLYLLIFVFLYETCGPFCCKIDCLGIDVCQGS